MWIVLISSSFGLLKRMPICHGFTSPPDKTELIVFGSKAQCQKFSSHLPVNIQNTFLHPADIVKNFSFQKHVHKTCKACFLQMHNLRRIRQYLTQEVAILAANALVSSRLDYCNSLFRGLACFNQHKLSQIIESILVSHLSQNDSTGCLSITTSSSNLQNYFTNFSTVILLAILDHPRLIAAAPTVPGIVALTINTLQFSFSTPHSINQTLWSWLCL